MAVKQEVVEVTFGGLYSTPHETQVPIGMATTMSNCTGERGILEGMGRYGTVTKPTGWVNTWLGYGLHFGEYTTSDGLTTNEEFLAVVRDPINNTAGKAWLYSINPSTGVWTKISKSGSAVEVAASAWQFHTFYDKDGYGRIYGVNETDGIWRRVIGGGSTEDHKWEQVLPEFAFGLTLEADLSRPPYQSKDWGSGNGSLTRVNLSGTAAANASITTQNYIKVAYAAPPATGTYCQCVFTYTSAYDLTGVDRLLVRIKNNRDGFLDIGTGTSVAPPLVAFSTDAATAINQAFIDGMTKINMTTEALVVGIDSAGQPTSHRAQEVYIICDLRSLSSSLKSGLRRICIAIEGDRSTNSVLEYDIWPLSAGGAYLYDIGDGNTYVPPTGDERWPDFEYCYTYVKSGGGSNVETTATRAIVRSEDVRGILPVPGYMPEDSKWTMWSWVSISPPVNATYSAAGYDKINVYRRVKTATTNEWYYMTQLNNSATPNYVDKIRASVILSTPGTYPVKQNLSFGDFTETLRAITIGSWKGHMVYAVDRKLYFSWIGNPLRLLPSPDSDFVPPNPDSDPGGGRTLFLSKNKADVARALATGDSLYASGDQSTYAIIGESAIFSSSPREANRPRGALSARAIVMFNGGAIVGSKDGAWAYLAGRTTAQGEADTTMAGEELTVDNRPAWLRLIGTTAANWSNLNMVYHEDDVWFFGPGSDNTGRFLKWCKPSVGSNQRQWIEGTWPKMAKAVSTVKYGLRGLTSDARFIRIGKDSSEADYTLDDASTVNWSYTTGKLLRARKRLVQVFIHGSGTPQVDPTITDGIKGAVTSPALTKVSNRIWALSVNNMPGFEHQITLSGVVGTDTVNKLVLIFEDEGEGYGN